MAPRILMVDDSREVLASFDRLLSERYEIFTAQDGDCALRACAEHGPFAVVVADYEMPGMKGIELLMRVRASWPETVGVLITGVVAVDVAIDALHNGRIFRFLEKPCPQQLLIDAIEDALAEHQRLASERELASSLRFSREALAHFNRSLDRLIGEQTDSLLRLNRFVVDLNATESLQGIADLTAIATKDLVGDRAIGVEVCARVGGSAACRAFAGPSSRSEQRRESARSVDGEIGALYVDEVDSEGRRLSTLHLSLLAAVAGSMAVAVHNQVRRRERDEAQQAMILALAKLAEQRDNETGKHLERVSLYCTLIAEGLREDGLHREEITDEFVRDLYRCAPLHDIGKVGIPDSILRKAGKLTPAEWEVMKTHTVIGAETLRSAMDHDSGRILTMSLDIAWCHHEFWNGCGYPRGLAGERIPLAARILALADVYDALTTVRPYKAAWTHEAAIDWIRKEAGTHFDPHCVESFVKRAALAEEIRARLADTHEEVLAHLKLDGTGSHAA